MSVDLTPPITGDLLALQAHVQTRLRLVPMNLIAIFTWNVVRELYLVSQTKHKLSAFDADSC